MLSTFLRHRLCAARRCLSRRDVLAIPTRSIQQATRNTSGLLSDDKYTQVKWYKQCEDDSVAFWRDAANDIEWSKFPQTIFKPHDATHQLDYSWFSDGELNITQSMLDRHVERGNGNRNAIIYDSPLTASKDKLTYSELLELVERTASYLRSRGIGKGDRILIYMPMIPEALIAMYASARIGAIHSVVFGGFASRELAKRIVDCKPKVIITASGGKESETKIVQYKPMLDEALRICHYEYNTELPQYVLLKQRPDICVANKSSFDELNVCEEDWEEHIISKGDPRDGKAESVCATHPLYILYTSGTTGTPKGIVRECGGYAVALNWTMKHFYAGNEGDVVMFASDIGWVVGHSYIAYAQLLAGATTVLFEGKPVGMPQTGAGTFWRLVQEHGIKSLFAAPTALRAIRKEDPYGKLLADKYDISCLDNFFLAGERCDPNTMQWIQKLFASNGYGQIRVTDHWWQTETGWPITGTMLGDTVTQKFEPSLGSGGLPIPGMMLRCVPPLTKSSDDEREVRSMPLKQIQSVNTGETGEFVLKLPLPPGTLGGVWNNPGRAFEAYLERYPGYYCTGDTGYIDEKGCVHIMSRVDDVINVSGHRLSTASIEQVIAEHDCIAECAVIGVRHSLKGEVPVGVVVKKQGFEHVSFEQIEIGVKQLVRDQFGAVGAYQETIVVEKLPKTRSGKILRRSLKEIYNTEHFEVVPATIEDETALSHFQTVLLKKRKSSQWTQM